MGDVELGLTPDQHDLGLAIHRCPSFVYMCICNPRYIKFKVFPSHVDTIAPIDASTMGLPHFAQDLDVRFFCSVHSTPSTANYPVAK